MGALLTKRTRAPRWRKTPVIVALLAGLTLGAYLLQRQPSSGSQETLGHHIARQMAYVTADVLVPTDLVFAGRQRLNILLVGTDTNYDEHRRPLKNRARADSILLLSLNRIEKTAALISIPRDTAAYLPKYGLRKINAAHAYGGIDMLLNIVRDQLCLDIHHYIKADFEGFIKLVDTLGGVNIDVERNMRYRDKNANLTINLVKGYQRLDGKRAEGYVRYRTQRMGDIGRAKRQQKLLKSLGEKISNIKDLNKLKEVVTISYKHIHTDMPSRTVLSLARFARQLKSDELQTATLPGDTEHYFWVPERHKAKEILRELCGYTFKANAWESRRSYVESHLSTHVLRQKEEKHKQKSTVPLDQITQGTSEPVSPLDFPYYSFPESPFGPIDSESVQPNALPLPNIDPVPTLDPEPTGFPESKVQKTT